jgi:hypothetical protein
VAVLFLALLLAPAAPAPAADERKGSPPKAAAAGSGAQPQAAQAGGPAIATVKLECIMPPNAKTGMGGKNLNPFGGSSNELPFFARNNSPNPVPAGMAIKWTLKGEQMWLWEPPWKRYQDSGEHRLLRPLGPGQQVKFLDYPPNIKYAKIKLVSCEAVAGPASATGR